MESLESKTLKIMREFNIRANKKLGQNFLISDRVIDDIVKGADVTKDDLVIEIGPGLGVLTNELCKNAGHVIAIELDTRFIEILNITLANFDNFEVINKDILKIDINSLIEPYKASYKNIKVIANLPYYITTPIIMKLLEDVVGLDSIVVMVQKEVADRFLASPTKKEYGAITVSVKYYGDVSVVTNAKSNCFLPSPEVDSTVIKIKLRKDSIVELKDKKLFFKLVKLAFTQRRKTVLNSFFNSGLFKMSKDELREFLKKLGIDENRRPETLSIYEYAEVSNMILD